MTQFNSISTNLQAATSPALTPTPESVLATTSSSSTLSNDAAPRQGLKRSLSPALSELQRVGKRHAANIDPQDGQSNLKLAEATSQAKILPIPELPEPFLVRMLQFSNGGEADELLTLSKKFNDLTIEARRQRVVELAKQPGRVTQENVPTLMELQIMGVVNPNLKNVLETMKPILAAQLDEEGVIARSTKAHAILQQAQRMFGQAGGLAQRIHGQSTEIGQVNAQGLTHGFGIRTYQTQAGTKYIGSFQNGYVSGFGYLKLQNGDCYEGTYVYGGLQGQGKIFSADGTRIEGTFVDNRLQGPGKEFRANGTRIEGTFVDSRLQGPGKKFRVDGTCVEGTYVDGSFQGPGKEFRADGTRIEGTFVNGQLNGLVKKFYNNGDRLEGIMENGCWQGKCTHYYANGDVSEVEIGSDSSSESDYVSEDDTP